MRRIWHFTLVPEQPDAALLFIKDDWQYSLKLSFCTPQLLFIKMT